MLLTAGGGHCYEIADSSIFQIIYYKSYKHKKKCCVVYKVPFIVFECVCITETYIITWTTIHTNAETHNIILVDWLGPRQENLTSILIEEPNLFARTVLCLLQSDSKAILAFMRGSCSMAWAHIALQTVKSVIKRSKTQESCHCPAGHTAPQLMFFNTSLHVSFLPKVGFTVLQVS